MNKPKKKVSVQVEYLGKAPSKIALKAGQQLAKAQKKA
jgi:hypothetical protein